MSKIKALYSVLNLKEFASTFEVRQAAEKLNSDEVPPEVEEALEILLNNELKDAYDTLLEAEQRHGGQLPPISDSEFRESIEALAVRLGVEAEGASDNTLRIVYPSEAQTVEETVPDLFFDVGRQKIHVTPQPFHCLIIPVTPVKIFLNVDAGVRQRKYEITHQTASEAQLDTESVGYVLGIGISDFAPSYDIAIVNETNHAVAMIPTGFEQIFRQSNSDIAHQFRVRSSPFRIRQLLDQYRDGLAEIVHRIDHNIPIANAKNSIQDFIANHY